MCSCQLVARHDQFGSAPGAFPSAGWCQGFFFFLGNVPKGVDASKAPRNHSPLFFADESALPLGVRVLSHLALDWLAAHSGETRPTK